MCGGKEGEVLTILRLSMELVTVIPPFLFDELKHNLAPGLRPLHLLKVLSLVVGVHNYQAKRLSNTVATVADTPVVSINIPIVIQ